MSRIIYQDDRNDVKHWFSNNVNNSLFKYRMYDVDKRVTRRLVVRGLTPATSLIAHYYTVKYLHDSL